MKPPTGPLSRMAARNVESVEAEIIQEKAASLARMSNRLREAMARLEEHDASGSAPEARPGLVAAAGEALWYYVVQREAAGLRGVEEILRDFRVPREVYIRMGPAPSKPG